tara:strand:- start:634 stop:1059 length:426 start_codon:yes stop_codon:yes gene_type:complete
MDIATIVILFLLGLWSIKHHYDNKWKIEQIKIEYKNLVKVSKKANQQTMDEFERTSHYRKDMKTMQSDLIEFRQSLINIDNKYRIKMKAYEENRWDRSEEQTRISEGIDLKDNIAFDPMENRTLAEKKAYDKLAKQIIGKL